MMKHLREYLLEVPRYSLDARRTAGALPGSYDIKQQITRAEYRKSLGQITKRTIELKAVKILYSEMGHHQRPWVKASTIL